MFLAVCDLDPAGQRKCLDVLCGASRELRAEVETLLKHDFEDSIFDEEVPVVRDERIGRTVRNYKLLERIGEGGMDCVPRRGYSAEATGGREVSERSHRQQRTPA